MSSASSPGSDRADRRAAVGTAMEIAIRLVVVFAIAAWCLRIVAPFVVVVIWAMIIAIAAEGPFERWCRIHGGRRGWAATSLVVLTLIAIMGPTIYLSGSLVSGAVAFTDEIKSGTLSVPPPSDAVASWPVIGQRVHDFWLLAADNVGEALQTVKPQLRAASRRLLSVAQSVGAATIQLILAIVIAGVMLARSEGRQQTVERIASRLFWERGEPMARLVRLTIRSVVQGILGVAVIQALLAGLGFVAVGLPGAGLWALLILVAAVVQVPVLLVMLAPILLVFSGSSTGVAMAFLVWSVLVSLLDNVLKPMLFGRGVQVPTAVIFVGAIGGMLTMGVIGLFVGAVVLAVGYELIVSWVAEDGEPGSEGEPAAGATPAS